MKYKIGELEVEAVQWNYNPEEILEFAGNGSNLLSGTASGLLCVGDLEIMIEGNSYLVKVSEDKLFSLPASQFEKIATKVKEPKFKVGDKVYFGIVKNNNCNIVCGLVSYIDIEDGIKNLYTVDGYKINEENLFTLEEALEKLKEL